MTSEAQVTLQQSQQAIATQQPNGLKFDITCHSTMSQSVCVWGGGGRRTSTDTSMVGFKSQQLLNKILADMAVTIWHERGFFSCIVSQCCMAIAATLRQTHKQCTPIQVRNCSKSVFWTVKNTALHLTCQYFPWLHQSHWLR